MYKFIVFPQIWQQDPTKTNPEYHQIKENNQIREVEVLKCVIRFVTRSKRFNKEKYGISSILSCINILMSVRMHYNMIYQNTKLILQLFTAS